MSDIFLKRIYTDIKDETWPEINGYYDFYQLPETIKQEVEKGAGKILKNRSFYRPDDFGSVALVYNNVAFITNTKTASTYYKNFFINQGWKLRYLKDVDFKNMYCVGLISDPIYRYFRGIAHCLLVSYLPNFEIILKDHGYTKEIDDAHNNVLESLNSEYFINFIKNVNIADKHTSRYIDLFEENLYSIDWIPFESGNRNTLAGFIEKALINKGIDIKIPLTDNELQKAQPTKKVIYKKIEDLYNNDMTNKLNELYYYYYQDINFYYDLVKKFNPKGNTWNEISWLKKQ